MVPRHRTPRDDNTWLFLLPNKRTGPIDKVQVYETKDSSVDTQYDRYIVLVHEGLIIQKIHELLISNLLNILQNQYKTSKMLQGTLS
jgi:hypothetical protein